jgi:outer membrane protein OmpA-like peptidoglycan-associated protein
MSRLIKGFLFLLFTAGLGACAAQPGEDYGLDGKKLSTLTATLWTDPLGCQHWIIDDLAEGYLAARRKRDGRPVCPGGRANSNVLSNLPRLSLEMGLWTDPNGCQHWVRDDGGEGFMSQRLDRSGRPVCPGASQSAPSQTITLAADALFDTDEAVLRPSAVSELTEFGQKMKQLGKSNVLIVGHTDSRASEQYNQRLSERRAQSVAAFLKQNFGITAQTRGRGELEPVASNDTPDGRQANRRVAISILD